MNLVSRNAWGAATPKNRTALVKSEQRGTAVHYSGSDSDESSDHRNCAKRVLSIQHFHMGTRKWADIAYSYLVCKHGFVFVGRGMGIRTAAQGTNSGNDAFHAVCFLGDDSANRDDVTDPGRRALKEAVSLCNGWAKVKEVRPHSFFHPTGCPGDELRSWIIRGMPVLPEKEDTGVSKADVLAALKDPDGQRQLETAVDHVMSQGLAGDRDAAIRAWAIKVEKTDANVRKILAHLGIEAE